MSLWSSWDVNFEGYAYAIANLMLFMSGNLGRSADTAKVVKRFTLITTLGLPPLGRPALFPFFRHIPSKGVEWFLPSGASFIALMVIFVT